MQQLPNSYNKRQGSSNTNISLHNQSVQSFTGAMLQQRGMAGSSNTHKRKTSSTVKQQPAHHNQSHTNSSYNYLVQGTIIDDSKLLKIINDSRQRRLKNGTFYIGPESQYVSRTAIGSRKISRENSRTNINRSRGSIGCDISTIDHKASQIMTSPPN